MSGDGERQKALNGTGPGVGPGAREQATQRELERVEKEKANGDKPDETNR